MARQVAHSGSAFLSDEGRLAWKDGAIGDDRSAMGIDVGAQVAVVVLAADERIEATTLLSAIMKDTRRLGVLNVTRLQPP